MIQGPRVISLHDLLDGMARSGCEICAMFLEEVRSISEPLLPSLLKRGDVHGCDLLD
jgi:hypothetical protein